MRPSPTRLGLLVLLAGCSRPPVAGPADGRPGELGLGRDGGQTESSWRCQTGAEGRTVCSSPLGLPPGGSGWRCHQATLDNVRTWVCYGQADAAPAGGGWTCSEATFVSLWKCTRPVGADDQPPGDASWACWKSSQAGGTSCERKDPTRSSDACYAGQKQWCSDQGDSWGQVDCDATAGVWRTRLNAAGQKELDCRLVLGGDQRPDTLCACYYVYFTGACCERPDCVLPDSGSGAVCPAGGATLCGYCNQSHVDDECKPGGRVCVVGLGESFCAPICSATTSCPGAYPCQPVSGGPTQVCAPSDLSCYY